MYTYVDREQLLYRGSTIQGCRQKKWSGSIRYTSKRMQQFVKSVHRFLIRNHATLLWFVREAPGYGIAALFAKCTVIFSECAVIRQTQCIFTAKGLGLRCFTRLHSLDCGTLQDGALQSGHQRVALLVGEKWHTCHHVFKCHRGTFVAIFDVYRTYDQFILYIHMYVRTYLS